MDLKAPIWAETLESKLLNRSHSDSRIRHGHKSRTNFRPVGQVDAASYQVLGSVTDMNSDLDPKMFIGLYMGSSESIRMGLRLVNVTLESIKILTTTGKIVPN